MRRNISSMYFFSSFKTNCDAMNVSAACLRTLGVEARLFAVALRPLHTAIPYSFQWVVPPAILS